MALLVVFLIVQACMAATARSDKEDTATGPSPTAGETSAPPEGTPPPDGQPVTHTTDEPSEPPEPTPGQECTDKEVVVIAAAGAEQVPQGGVVEVKIEIRNDSDRECRRDIGGSQRELFIRAHGSAGKVWSSRDCTELTGNDVRDLPPGVATSVWAPWNTRTSGDCTELGEAAGPLVEPGEYELVARLGTLYSEPVRIVVTG